MSDALAIIPARYGSKGIPHKNYKPLVGLCPMFRAVNCCMDVPAIGQVIVSAEAHEAPWQISERSGRQTYYRRPMEYAQDDTPMIEVVRDVLRAFDGPEDQIILLVQPTQPLREPKHLKDAIRLMDNGAASVVSLVESEHPDRMLRILAGCDNEHFCVPDTCVHFNRVWMATTSQYIEDMTPVVPTERRQDVDSRAYRRDGTVYAFRRCDVGGLYWYSHPCVPLIIPKSETCELDTPEDWAIAEVRLAAKEAMQRA